MSSGEGKTGSSQQTSLEIPCETIATQKVTVKPLIGGLFIDTLSPKVTVKPMWYLSKYFSYFFSLKIYEMRCF